MQWALCNTLKGQLLTLNSEWILTTFVCVLVWTLLHNIYNIFLEMPCYTLHSHLNSVTARQLLSSLGLYQFVIVDKEERLSVISCNGCMSKFWLWFPVFAGHANKTAVILTWVVGGKFSLWGPFYFLTICFIIWGFYRRSFSLLSMRVHG